MSSIKGREEFMLNRWIVNCIKFHDGALYHNAGNTFTTSKLCVDILYRRNTANQKYQRDWVNPKSCELSGCVKVAFVKGVYSTV